MKRHTRTALAVGTILASVLALSACAILGPSRGPDGQVTATTEIVSTQLLVGDCFSFVDGTNHNRSLLTPCTEDHAYIVIAAGTLTQAKIDADGGLQNSVSAACASTFADFKAAAAEGTKPEQEFIVSTADKDGETVTNYSCVATDAAPTAEATTPAPTPSAG